MVSTIRQQVDEQRRQRTRRSLLDASAIVFGRKGYHATLISDIAAEAGVGQGTFYRNFDNKRQVFEILFDEFMGSLLAEFADMSAHPPTNVDEYMEASVAGVKRVAAIALQHQDLTRLFLREGPAIDAEFEQKLAEVADRFSALAKFYLDHAITSGFARPCDTTLVSQSIVGLSLWQSERFLSGRMDGADTDEAIEELVRFVFWGFGPRDGQGT